MIVASFLNSRLTAFNPPEHRTARIRDSADHNAEVYTQFTSVPDLWVRFQATSARMGTHLHLIKLQEALVLALAMKLRLESGSVNKIILTQAVCLMSARTQASYVQVLTFLQRNLDRYIT